ncbi:MAG: peptidase S1 [Rhodothermaceae bacterium]|nr:peptidase S1 [Rhodothermaceae bacterium]
MDPRDSGDGASGYTGGQAPDLSLEPTFGFVELDEGFLPDPSEVELTAGGSVDVNVGGCSYGYVANAPDVKFRYATSGDSDLYIYAISGDDTTLLINTATGSWLCDDDSYGDGDPIVVIPNAPAGRYDIWVGTYGDDLAPASLYISEIDPR